MPVVPTFIGCDWTMSKQWTVLPMVLFPAASEDLVSVTNG